MTQGIRPGRSSPTGTSSRTSGRAPGGRRGAAYPSVTGRDGIRGSRAAAVAAANGKARTAAAAATTGGHPPRLGAYLPRLGAAVVAARRWRPRASSGSPPASAGCVSVDGRAERLCRQGMDGWGGGGGCERGGAPNIASLVRGTSFSRLKRALHPEVAHTSNPPSCPIIRLSTCPSSQRTPLCRR